MHYVHEHHRLHLWWHAEQAAPLADCPANPLMPLAVRPSQAPFALLVLLHTQQNILEHSINRIAVEDDGHRFPLEHVSPDGHPPEQPLPEAMLTL